MIDNYQAVYDATRSRMSNGDIGEAVLSAFRDANLGHYSEMCFQTFREVLSAYDRPSAIYKPKLSQDGNMWCALLGDDLQVGLAGFGKTPDLAMSDFDQNWYKVAETLPTQP